MSTTMKVSLLALVSTVAAIPHYGHSKFHSLKPTGAVGTGNGAPYPSGGWQGPYNNTRIPYPTGNGSSDDDKTIDVTTTSTTTVYSTIVVKPSSVSENKVVAEKKVVENASKLVDGQCGPATITVTASEKVTVTVTPGGGAGAPSSSLAPVKSKGPGYGVPSKGEETAPSKVEEVRTTKAPAPSPVQPQSSKAEEYEVISSVAQKPVESVAPSSAAQKPVESVAPSSAAPSSEAPKPTPSSVNTYSGTKRGLAYNDASLCKSFGSNFGFGYNWGQVENNDIGTNFIPMMHGPSKATSQEWLANVEKAAKKGSKAVMGFNEPDHAEQANLSPEAACSAWKEYMNPIASKHPELTIIGPSVTNGAAPMGLDWLSRFHTACPDAVVHASNIHFYDIYESATIDRFKAQVEKAAQLYGKPVWVTEFGLNPGSASTEQAATFLKEAMAYLDASDNVQGYSYFMVGSGENQLNSGSSIGQLYAGSN